MNKTWRQVAAPIIARVLAETAGLEWAIVREALRQAYPFGERRYFPYKVWLDEIKRQRGKKKHIVDVAITPLFDALEGQHER